MTSPVKKTLYALPLSAMLFTPLGVAAAGSPYLCRTTLPRPTPAMIAASRSLMKNIGGRIDISESGYPGKMFAVAANCKDNICTTGTLLFNRDGSGGVYGKLRTFALDDNRLNSESTWGIDRKAPSRVAPWKEPGTIDVVDILFDYLKDLEAPSAQNITSETKLNTASSPLTIEVDRTKRFLFNQESVTANALTNQSCAIEAIRANAPEDVAIGVNYDADALVVEGKYQQEGGVATTLRLDVTMDDRTGRIGAKATTDQMVFTDKGGKGHIVASMHSASNLRDINDPDASVPSLTAKGHHKALNGDGLSNQTSAIMDDFVTCKYASLRPADMTGKNSNNPFQMTTESKQKAIEAYRPVSGLGSALRQGQKTWERNVNALARQALDAK